MVHCVIRAYYEINRTAVWPTEYLLCSNKYKTKNLCDINNVMFIGEPGGCNRSRVSNTSRVSNRSRGGLTLLF